VSIYACLSIRIGRRDNYFPLWLPRRIPMRRHAERSRDQYRFHVPELGRPKWCQALMSTQKISCHCSLNLKNIQKFIYYKDNASQIITFNLTCLYSFMFLSSYILFKKFCVKIELYFICAARFRSLVTEQMTQFFYRFFRHSSITTWHLQRAKYR